MVTESMTGQCKLNGIMVVCEFNVGIDCLHVSLMLACTGDSNIPVTLYGTKMTIN